MDHPYPLVQKLVKALSEHNISFKVLQGDEQLDELFYRIIEINISGEVFSIPVMDEYDDVDLENPVVLLHLALQECEFYEAAEDFLVWAKDIGLDASSEIARQIHLDLGQVVPQIREKLPHLNAVPSYEIEFNNSVAKALRKLKF